MPRANAQAWWADVEDVRERIERRRASEGAPRRPQQHAQRRTVSISGHPDNATAVLSLVSEDALESKPTYARSRRQDPPGILERISARPDRLAGWAVMLGFILVLVTILSTHG
ncbi:MAG TPA: hypothetical protein VID48_09415 [Solirubrobacteraceae bacterium]